MQTSFSQQKVSPLHPAWTDKDLEYCTNSHLKSGLLREDNKRQLLGKTDYSDMDDSEVYFKGGMGEEWGVTYWWVTKQENELVDIWERSKFSVNTIPSASEATCLPEGPRAQLLETGCAVSFTLCIGGAGDCERDKESICV